MATTKAKKTKNIMMGMDREMQRQQTDKSATDPAKAAKTTPEVYASELTDDAKALAADAAKFSADVRKVDIVEVFVLFYLLCSVVTNVAMCEAIPDPILLIYLLCWKAIFNFIIRFSLKNFQMFTGYRCGMFFFCEIIQLFFLLNVIFWKYVPGSGTRIPFWVTAGESTVVIVLILVNLYHGEKELYFVTVCLLLFLINSPPNSWRYYYLTHVSYTLLYLLEGQMSAWREEKFTTILLLSLPLLKLPISFSLPYFFLFSTYRTSVFLHNLSTQVAKPVPPNEEAKEKQVKGKGKPSDKKEGKSGGKGEEKTSSLDAPASEKKLKSKEVDDVQISDKKPFPLPKKKKKVSVKKVDEFPEVLLDEHLIVNVNDDTDLYSAMQDINKLESEVLSVAPIATTTTSGPTLRVPFSQLKE